MDDSGQVSEGEKSRRVHLTSGIHTVEVEAMNESI